MISQIKWDNISNNKIVSWLFKKRVKWFLLGILIIALLLRIYHFDYPFIESHGQRESDTADLARNFYENGFNIFRLEISSKGPTDMLVGFEFQLVSFIASLLYIPFGIHEWIGRAISIFFSLGSILVLYKLTALYYNRRIALFCAFFFAVSPLNVYFSRMFMYSSVMLFFSISSLYFFSKWLKDEKISSFALSIFCTAMAFLVNIQTLYLLIPLAFLAFYKYRIKILISKKIWLFLILVLVFPILYYYHMHEIAKESGTLTYVWNFSSTGWWSNLKLLLSPDFYAVIGYRVLWIALTPIGFFLGVAGYFLPMKTREELVFKVWLWVIFLYFLILATRNYNHSYYQLPIVPVACIFMGKVADALYTYIRKTDEIDKLKTNHSLISRLDRVYFRIRTMKHITFLILFLLLFLALSGWISYGTYNREKYTIQYYNAGRAIYWVSEENDVILSSGGDTTLLYYSNRNGWGIDPSQSSISTIENYKSKGADYFVSPFYEKVMTDKEQREYLVNNYLLITDGWSYVAFNLNEKSTNPVLINGPIMQNSTNVNFNNEIELLGFNISSTKVAHGEAFEVVYFWKCLNETSKDYSVSVKFRGPNNNEFHQDHKIAYGLFPTYEWKVGDVIKERYLIIVPPTIKGGTYSMEIGLYDNEGYATIVGAQSDTDKEVRIAAVEVEETYFVSLDVWVDSLFGGTID